MGNRTTRIIIFLIVSLSWSLWWFWTRPLAHMIHVESSPLIIYLGLIPTLGLVVMSVLLRRYIVDKQISLFGKSTLYSMLIASLAPIGLCIIGVDNDFGMQVNLFGLYIGVGVMIYAFCEEVGWRGYMQEEIFKDQNVWIGYIFIGVMWYLWHWYFIREGGAPAWFMLLLLITGSIGIGEIARNTRSMVVCGVIHGYANIAMMYPLIANGISPTEKYILLGVCILITIVLLKKMERLQES